MLVLSTIEFALTLMSPPTPDVPETRLNRDPDASVRTLAVTPTEEELMAEARPASPPPITIAEGMKN